MSFLTKISILLIIVMQVGTGCQSIRSDAVRELIEIEKVKIDESQRNINLLSEDTKKRNKWMEDAVAILNDSFIGNQKAEARNGLLLSQGATLPAKPGIRAQALAFEVGRLYLREYEGLNKVVRNQFLEDFCALLKIVASLDNSWKNLGMLHHEIHSYSNKTGLASVDPSFVTALLGETSVTSNQIANVLDTSRTVNDALEEVVGARILQGRWLERGHSVSADLVNLLERLSPK